MVETTQTQINTPATQGTEAMNPSPVQKAKPDLNQYRSMASSNRALEIARSTMGMHENQQRHALVSFMSNGGVNIDPAVTPWCAGFVNAVITQAGMKGTGSLAARSFLNWGRPVEGQPQIGDIVVLSRGSNPNQGHVGFFKGYDERGRILVLGGNQGDKVSIAPYEPSRLLGFRTADGIRDEAPGYTGEERLVDMMMLAGDEGNPLGLPVAQAPVPQQQVETADASERPGVAPVEAQQPQSGGDTRQGASASQRASQALSEQAVAVLRRFGVEDVNSLPQFGTPEELDQAIDDGRVAANSIAILNGRPVRING